MKKTEQKENRKATEQVMEPVRKVWRWPINPYWLLLGVGIGLFGLAVLVGSLWMANPLNQWLGFLTIALFIGGVVLVIRQVKHRHDVGNKAMVNIRQEPGDSKDQIRANSLTPNSLNIYAAKDEDIGEVVPQRIVFENVYKPLGQPQRCLNTNRDYYVHIWDIGKSRLVPFVLADRKYTDPSILARYLGLPAQRKYLRNRESLMRLIGPGLLAVGVVIGFIAIIALGG